MKGLIGLRQKFARAASFAKTVSSIKSLSGNESPDELIDIALQHEFIRPYQVRSEFLRFARMVKDLAPRNVLEIGTFKGGTIFIMARLAAPGAQIISMDISRVPVLRRKLYSMFPHDGGRMSFLSTDSHSRGALEAVKAELQWRKLDLLFIDGDHSYAGARRDFEMYSPLVRPGGLVAFHDILPHPKESGCEVDRLWRELAKNFRHTELVHDSNQQWAGIGVLHMPERCHTAAATY